jgi:hypothetical protein
VIPEYLSEVYLVAFLVFFGAFSMEGLFCSLNIPTIVTERLEHFLAREA